jgi:acetyl esterase
MTPYVRPDVKQFLDYLNAQPGPRTHELPAAEARQLFKALPQLADLPPEPLATVRDLSIPGLAGPIPARLFDAAASREPGPAVVFFHGGGFVIGDLDTHAGPCSTIARTLGLPVIAVDYRLAPEAKWPAAPDDCEAAARWIAESPAELGRGVTGLVLCGDSAGGTLTLVTAAALRDRPAAAPVLVQAPLYPAADLTHFEGSMQDFADGYMLTHDTMRWFADAYAADLQHARGNPIRADVAGMPPAVIVTAGLDPLRDQGRRYAGALIAAGVPVIYREAAGNIHGFLNLRRTIPSSQADLMGFLAALKPVIAEAEGARVMRQAAGAAA